MKKNEVALFVHFHYLQLFKPDSGFYRMSMLMKRIELQFEENQILYLTNKIFFYEVIFFIPSLNSILL